MLIVEHFFLIACDPRSGLPDWPRHTQAAGQLAAAAVLLDLAALHRLQLRGASLHADASVPLPHYLLSAALHHLGETPLPVASALERVERRLHPLLDKILDGLSRRDVLHRVERRRWLFWRRVSYPLRSVQARNEASERLRLAVRDGDDMHGLALLLLADISGLLPKHLNAREYEVATQRLLALNERNLEADETHALFACVRDALLA